MSVPALLWFNAVLAVAAVGDLRVRRIPNVLPILLALGGALLDPPASLAEGGGRLASCLIVTAVTGALWLRGLMGGGDVKLLAACALWIPLPALAAFGMFVAWAGAIQGIAALLAARLTARGDAAAVGRLRMPYALSIAAAGVAWSVLRLR